MATTQAFFPEELAAIQSLPPEIQDLGADHTQTLSNLSSVWNLPDLDKGYVPQVIDIYVEESEDPIITIENGEPSCQLEFFPQEFTCVSVEIDYVLRYCEIRGQEVFNTLGSVTLPFES